jgi:putative oxidoreductase
MKGNSRSVEWGQLRLSPSSGATMEAKRQDMTNSIGLLILRLGVGGFMATHGWGKLQMIFDGEWDQIGDPVGLGPHLSLIMVVMAEFFAAILVVIGLGTRVAAALPVFAMFVAAFVIHIDDPLTMTEGAMKFFSGESKSWASKEPALLFMIPFLALIFTGAGKYSIDGMIWPKWRERRAMKKAATK